MIDRLHRAISGSSLRLVGVVATTTLAAGLAAAQPSFSGPSITRLAEKATFNGGALPPNAAVTVFVTSPGGNTAGYGAVASPSGKLQYVLAPTQTGTYRLALTDSGGRKLAAAVIAVLP